MQDSLQLSELVDVFHRASDSLTRYFTEQGSADNDVQFALDEIDRFLSSANPDPADSEQFLQFNTRANELILLIDHIMVFASDIKHSESFGLLEEFLLLFVLWFAGNGFAKKGGKITSLTPVVNLIAARSNRLREPEALKKLMADIGIIINATEQSIQEDMDVRDPRRPWRVLLLNYAITATRTHNPENMEKAFQVLILHLPDDLRQFFTEGMSQMVALDYPESVRVVMQRYYQQYALQDIKNN